MRATRDRRVNDPVYLQYLDDLAKEQAAIKAEQDALADQTPEAMYKRAADQEANAIRELLRTGYVPDSLLPDTERMNGRVISNQQAAINNWKYFADTCETFQIWMGRQLLDASERSDLAPIAPNYKKLHELMLQYSAYEEPAQPVAQPETRYEDVEIVDPRSLLSPSEQAVYDHQQYIEKVVGHDEFGKGWTDAELDRLPAKEELRLRRLFSTGTRGDSRLLEYRERQDIKAVQEAERARIAAEQNGGN
jgi:hypothetical protein